MENIIQILLISVIQGIAEFIPVSSSAHINLLSNLFNYEKFELAVNVSAHFGSLVAVLFYFNKEIYNFSKNKNLFYKVIIASIPIFIIGYILIELKIISNLRTIEIMGWTTIIFGILLYISDKFKIKLKIKNNFTFRNAIIIGFYQTLALIPGVSRSGIIITGARFLKFNRVDSGKLSFLLSIPALAGASFLGLKDLYKESRTINSEVISTDTINETSP